ncbi:MAG: proteasome-activating nucleotidase [Desulfurococcales archaeon ex4484_58]|nr:MAG: proteasome-activating nucleotidase [Desulfurococcales archaeon ex4484_58]
MSSYSRDADEAGEMDIDYIRALESRVRELEIEREKLIMRIRYYRAEIEKLLSTPLIEAVVVKLLDDNRAIVKSTTGPNLIVNISSNVSREKLRPGQHVALNQRGSTIVAVLPEYEDPYVSSMEVIEKPNVSFNDIGGLHEQILELKEVVELPLKNPDLFREIGIEPPKGVLLYGPPGCGKTLLAKAVAHEAGATFISIVGSELVQKFIGEGARIVREVFSLARRKAPSIVFIDEIDSIAARRLDIGTSGEREVQRTLMQLLAELDGFRPLDRVKVIAATNRVDILDPAILRPGRFDRLIEVPLPDLRGRYEIFKVHTRKMKISSEVDLMELARMTEGASGAEIKAIVTEAGYYAIRDNRREVVMDDFLKAVRKVMGKREVRGLGNIYKRQDYSMYILQ